VASQCMMGEREREREREMVSGAARHERLGTRLTISRR
jgi:hypothetical protein